MTLAELLENCTHDSSPDENGIELKRSDRADKEKENTKKNFLTTLVGLTYPIFSKYYGTTGTSSADDLVLEIMNVLHPHLNLLTLLTDDKRDLYKGYLDNFHASTLAKRGNCIDKHACFFTNTMVATGALIAELQKNQAKNFENNNKMLVDYWDSYQSHLRQIFKNNKQLISKLETELTSNSNEQKAENEDRYLNLCKNSQFMGLLEKNNPSLHLIFQKYQIVNQVCQALAKTDNKDQAYQDALSVRNKEILAQSRDTKEYAGWLVALTLLGIIPGLLLALALTVHSKISKNTWNFFSSHGAEICRETEALLNADSTLQVAA